ncbi:MAG: ribosome recycling factor [Clostridiales bacterium]|jgi:ribosome recycling factor|nr:ribosome recycling factor [Clostridiales bacterium]
MSNEYKVYEDKMQKSTEFLSRDLAAVRAGRASAAVLDPIMVDYYGSPTPINQIATISSPDPRSLLISPWDQSVLPNLTRAIQASDLGINPQSDGKNIRLIFPQLTEERRHELNRQVKKYAEDTKVAIRNIRREAMDDYKRMEKNSEITEDDLRNSEKDINNLTDKWVKKVDEIAKAKEDELFEI